MGNTIDKLYEVGYMITALIFAVPIIILLLIVSSIAWIIEKVTRK